MRLVFMGTPDFAVPSLEQIAKSGHEIVAVITGPDKQQGRGRKLRQTPVKNFALSLNVPVLQPHTLKSRELHDQLRILEPDIFVVVAFRILPKSLIEIPRLGAINLHASLLPKYRGAAPINWAIINGDKETGNTVFRIQPKVDTGEILLQEKIAIEADDTAGSIHDKLSEIGGPLLVKALDLMESGDFKTIRQDDQLATKAPKIYPDTGKIDWQQPAVEICNLIHGLSPWPAGFSRFGKRRIKFLKAHVIGENSHYEAGQIALRTKHDLGIQCGNGILMPKEIHMEGKKALPVSDFLRGFQGKVGERFTG